MQHAPSFFIKSLRFDMRWGIHDSMHALKSLVTQLSTACAHVVAFTGHTWVSRICDCSAVVSANSWKMLANCTTARNRQAATNTWSQLHGHVAGG